MSSLRSFLLALLATCSLPGVADDAPDFAREVRPILSNLCFKCHGPDEEARQADLRLDVKSRVDVQLILERIQSTDVDVRMPPSDSGLSLSEQQRQILERWISSGAHYETHWSFQPIVRPDVPSGATHPVDGFVLQQLDRDDLALSPEADRHTLIRRVSLDVRGLPPTPEEIEQYLNDEAGGAYERMIDRMLASPHYGEKWGRHWLDQARYADSNGYTIDSPRSMWPWRDWVIQAINDDMPFDQFTIEQLAGDLLEDPTRQQLIATGFHRNTLINQEGGTDREQFRNEAVVDRTNTTGAVWLGLTVGCAQCHTHKYDPLTHREYYQLFAFFNNGEDVNSTEPIIRVPTSAQEDQRRKLSETIAKRQRALKAFDDAHSQEELAEEQKTRRAELEKSLKEAREARDKHDKSCPSTMVMRDRKERRPTHILTRGDFLRPADEVSPTGPAFLPAMPEEGSKPRTRLDLARWLMSPQHPLTARVAVNRIWMQLFGRGLVETENDFGLQGTLPTHPQLLDWLAAEFIGNGWSRRELIRTVLTSATYRQSSVARPESAAKDPLNKLLSRQSRVRVDAEIVRDLVLAVSGLLNPKIGGPGVYPPQPDGVYAFTQRKADWPTNKDADRYRRGMYTFFIRSAPHPMLTTFDAPFFNTTCTHRVRSNTPLQSLTMANDQAFVEASQALGRRLVTSASTDTTRVHLAWRLCFARPAAEDEQTRMLHFIAETRQRFEQDSTAALAISGLTAEDSQLTDCAVWTTAARGLLNLDEFITRE